MLFITTQNPVFGKGYFIGFDKDGNPHFQSCFDKRVKTYKSNRNVLYQLDRIRNTPLADKDGTTYDIETTMWLDENCPSCPPRYCGTCIPGDCRHNQPNIENWICEKCGNTANEMPDNSHLCGGACCEVCGGEYVKKQQRGGLANERSGQAPKAVRHNRRGL